MEETFNTKAIILNRQPFKECDTKVSVFCLDGGKLGLVARGTKKISSKMAGHLEPITLSNIMVVRGKQYDYIGSAINDNAFLNIKNDYGKIDIAGQAVSIFQKLIKENETDEKLFNLLNDFFSVLNDLRFTIYDLRIFNFFILKLISNLGHKPELYDCVVCKKKIITNNNKFSLSKGGVICNKCGKSEALTISNDCIKVLRLIVDEGFKKIVKLKIDNKLEKEVEKIIGSFYKYHF